MVVRQREMGMELPRGITGFRHVSDPPLPVCDLAAFRGHCFAAARALKVRVARKIGTSEVEPNFAYVVLELRNRPIAVLLNRHFPVVAFAEPLVEGEAFVRFSYVPELGEAFREFGVYEVADESVLTESLKPEHLQRLAPAEREQIRYWKPRQVGEVMFNFWD